MERIAQDKKAVEQPTSEAGDESTTTFRCDTRARASPWTKAPSTSFELSAGTRACDLLGLRVGDIAHENHVNSRAVAYDARSTALTIS
jgi:hypothetical protein